VISYCAAESRLIISSRNLFEFPDQKIDKPLKLPSEINNRLLTGKHAMKNQAAINCQKTKRGRSKSGALFSKLNSRRLSAVLV